MFKLILIFIVMFLIGFFVVDESRNVTLSAFGYEVTFSIVLLLFALILVSYLLYLLSKPFGWANRYKSYCAHTKVCRKEDFLTDVLAVLASGNKKAGLSVLKKGRSLYEETDKPLLLAHALLDPQEKVFEKLYQTPETRLAGLKGLIQGAMKEGQLQEAERLVERDFQQFKSVDWLAQTSFELQILQNDWEGALVSLEALYKNGLIDKETYITRKALILMQLNRFKEAFKLDPAQPAIALARAKAEPEKARDILSASYHKTPSYETFLAYYETLQEETPAKRVKRVEKLIASHPNERASLLALAKTAFDAHLYGMAKEQMEIYFKSFPVTRVSALLMAQIVREGWHHEQEALRWENKAATIEDKAAWVCTACHQGTPTFSPSCPQCNAFGALKSAF